MLTVTGILSWSGYGARIKELNNTLALVLLNK